MYGIQSVRLIKRCRCFIQFANSSGSKALCCFVFLDSGAMASPWCFVDQGYPWEEEAFIEELYRRIAQGRRDQLLDACVICWWSVADEQRHKRKMAFETLMDILESYLMSDIFDAWLAISRRRRLHDIFAAWLAVSRQ